MYSPPVKLMSYFKTLESLETHFDNNVSFAEWLSPLDKLLATDYKTFQTDDVLVKVDRVTMSVGLEG